MWVSRSFSELNIFKKTIIVSCYTVNFSLKQTKRLLGLFLSHYIPLYQFILNNLRVGRSIGVSRQRLKSGNFVQHKFVEIFIPVSIPVARTQRVAILKNIYTLYILINYLVILSSRSVVYNTSVFYFIYLVSVVCISLNFIYVA